MKLIALFITITVLHVSAATFAQKITLNITNAPLSQVIDEIRNQSGYDFFYNLNLIKKAKPVTINVRDSDLKDVLAKCFDTQPLTYTITVENKAVVIKEKETPPTVIASPAIAGDAGMLVNGQVVNKYGQPLTGATVIIKRTKTGTTTDVYGYFTLKSVEPSDTLVIRYIGYKPYERAIGKDPFYKIVMLEATNGLDEVVVQAYGQTTRRLMTGNIGRVTAADIASQPVTNPLLALEGRIAGVTVSPTSGYIGGPVKVEIRGRGNINPNFLTEPLYIVDGVPLTVLNIGQNGAANFDPAPVFGANGTSSTAISGGFDQTGLSPAQGQSPLYNINPSDIASIEVLKDADATSIYGSRGANGVVLITTKHGKPGANSLDISVGEGVDFNTRPLPLLNTQQYLEARTEAFHNSGLIPSKGGAFNVSPLQQFAPDLTILSPTSYTDWQKYAYGTTGKVTNVYASLSGGSDQVTFRLGAGYTNNQPITRRSGTNQSASLSFNLTNTSKNKKLVTSLDANYGYSENNQVNLAQVAFLPPNAPAGFNPDGSVNFLDYYNAGLSNPFAAYLKPYTARTNFLVASLNINYTIFKGFNAQVQLGYNNVINNQTTTEPIAALDPYAYFNAGTTLTGDASFGTTRVNNVIVEPQLNYHSLIGKGNLSLLLGSTFQSNTTDGLTVHGEGYTSDVFIRSISLAPHVTATDNYAQYKYGGVFARIAYEYENKYNINLNGRRDGSSRFGPGNQFGNFGSVGAAWIASEENWAKKVLPKVITLLKLRGSYGTTGSDQVSDYQFLSQWGNGGQLVPYGGIASLVPQIQPNRDFHWSSTQKLEGSVTVELLNGLLIADATYYRDRTNNQLVNFPIANITGFSTVTANSPADVQNSGWEFSVTNRLGNPAKHKLSVVNTLNIGFNHNKLLGYPGLDQSPYRFIYKIGASLDDRYVLHYTGIDPLTGGYTFEDFNHDGLIYQGGSTSFPGTGKSDQRVVINSTPVFTGGLSSNIAYRQFQLSLNFSFVKQKGINPLAGSFAQNSTFGSDLINLPLQVYQNRWQYPGQVALYPKFQARPNQTQIDGSDEGITDASYLRLQTVSLSYSMPASITKKIGLRSLAINIRTNDLFVITAYGGFDPQLQNIGGQPMVRTIQMGLNAGF